MAVQTYEAHVRIPGYGTTTTSVQAASTVIAKKLLENQHGRGNVMSAPRVVQGSR